MDLIIKVYNQYFRNVDSQRWKYVGFQYWYNVGNWCCTNAVHRYHFDCPPTVGFRQSEIGIQRWIDVGPIVNFCLGRLCRWFGWLAWFHISFFALGVVVIDPFFITTNNPMQKWLLFEAFQQHFGHSKPPFNVSRLLFMWNPISLLLNVSGCF